MSQRVIGIAGHIDHGKTALVLALTGVNTDTQAEEQRRGMSIDIGFAFLTADITLVDVPGHDRFVKNMVRGVAGIHMGLLVVAADDGVMPQTREHFHILRLLGVSDLAVVITKIDLVDADWTELVQEDVEKLLSGSPYADGVIYRVSAQSGEGVEQLKEALITRAGEIDQWRDRGFFLLPVDRVFSVKGFGSVVTGTVLAGAVSAGQRVMVYPGGDVAKTRGLQTHGHEIKRALLGDRAAINLGNLSLDQLAKGGRLAEPDSLTVSTIAAVEVTLLDDAPRLRYNHPVRVNIGTAEVMARIKWSSAKYLDPGERGGALLSFAGPVALIHDEPFILRSFSPVTTIGGGKILDPAPPEKWSKARDWIQTIYPLEPDQRIEQMVAHAGPRPLTVSQLCRRISLSREVLTAMLPGSIEHFGSGDAWLLTGHQQAAVTDQIAAAISQFHGQQPFVDGANREYIRYAIAADDKFLEHWLKRLESEGILSRKDELWANPDFSIELTGQDQLLLTQITSRIKAHALTPEYSDDWIPALGADSAKIQALVALAEGRGDVIRVGQRFLFHRELIDNLIANVQAHLDSHGSLTVSDMKALTGATRKHTVPLLEYLDRRGITLRVGDKRVDPHG